MFEKYKEYVYGYDITDVDIKCKYDHSVRVMNLMEKYAKLLNFTDEEISISKIVGLLHDIGRYEQLTRYHTYNDAKSVDHADYSVVLLFDNGLIKNFCENEEWYEVIKFAIKNHNKYDLPRCDDERTIKIAKLIRDVDKVDILYLIGVLGDLNHKGKDEEISEGVLECVKKHKLINSKITKCYNDKLAVHMAFAFDINYDVVLEEYRNNFVIYYNRVENNNRFYDIYVEVMKYIEMRINKMKEIATKYNHLEVEKNKYEEWKGKGYFESGDKSKDPFCIVIPPPNVTGKLHLGHALDVSIQDIIIRYKRMQGFDCLWLPGMDHAAIATEAKVVKKLKESGIDKYEYGREKFLEACWDWTHEYSDNIRDQWAKVGISVDYNKERFTLDEGLNKAVTKVFVDYYNEGIIYKGEKIINWDPVAQTALSNEEVIYKDVPGAFYHLKYYIENSDEYLDVATTRPETLFGDTAVAVNPSDKRYKKLIGKNVILPIVNKLIPIVGDEHADPEFGTGVVKITPAHDPNDFEVGNRHNLERVIVMNPDGTMNSNALQYQGMSREMCREELIKDLDNAGLLIKIEKMTHSVGHSERTGVMVEPYLSKQWFVKMGDLAKNVLDTQKKKDEKVNFIPERFEKVLNHWMEISYDWCISRQLWWGHRIPAWYRDDEIYVGLEAPTEKGWVQDEDVLDTWFSSALWPFSTLGWPEKTEDMERFYPNDVLVTAYDIIFFWVARMVFQAEHITGKRPFKDCIIHGLIRDKEGRKMSKSLGNGVDPMDMIDKYGADALRFYLATDVALGTDLRFDEEKVASTWNFINKLWNASRFVLINIDGLTKYNFDNLSDEDKWILTKYEEIVKRTTKHMDKYELNLVGSELYDFIWNDFCSSYIEFAKFNLDNDNTKSVLTYVLTGIIKLLHPFMPFVTEEIYNMLPIKDNESIMISEYPKYNKKNVFVKEKKDIDIVIEYISIFRNRKAEAGIGNDFEVITDIDNKLILKMLKLTDKIVEKSNLTGTVEVCLGKYKIIICYDDSKQKVEELDNLKKEADSLKASIERRSKLLANQNYVAKAPEKIVSQERENLSLEEEKLKLVLERIDKLQ